MSVQLKPTESELEILQVLWQKGSSSVREVNETLNTGREIGYTTTLKLMQIMHEKGLVSRNTESRSHIYTATVSQESVQSQMLTKFLNQAFQGSASKLVMQLLGQHRASPSELNEIKEMIDQLEKNEKA
jgi:predicted transcriptional regulator